MVAGGAGGQVHIQRPEESGGAKGDPSLERSAKSSLKRQLEIAVPKRCILQYEDFFP